MITASEVVPLMLARCPGFQPRWDQHVESWKGAPAGLYNDVGQFATFLVNEYSAGSTEPVLAGLDLLEELLETGDQEVRHLVITGVLEDIQNVASHRAFGYSVFEQWLGPRSLEAWRMLEQAWKGKSSLAEVVEAEVREARGDRFGLWWSKLRRIFRPRSRSINPESIENPELRRIVEELTRHDRSSR